jgi:sugar phosphate isomerase/epimerase
MLDQPADVLLDAAAAAGFDGVGLRLSAEHATADPADLGARAARLGLTIHDAEVHRVGDAPTDPRPLIERAASVGAAAVLVVSDARERATTLSELTRFADACAERGLVAGLEYMAWTTPNEPVDAIGIARATGCRLVVDLLHHVRVGGTVDQLRTIVDAGVLGWVQLCDAPLDPPADGDLLREARHGRLLPGTGGLPLRALLDVVPGGTTISVEVQSDALLSVDPLERARRLHDAAVSLLAGQSPSSTG